MGDIIHFRKKPLDYMQKMQKMHNLFVEAAYTYAPDEDAHEERYLAMVKVLTDCYLEITGQESSPAINLLLQLCAPLLLELCGRKRIRGFSNHEFL